MPTHPNNSQAGRTATANGQGVSKDVCILPLCLEVCNSITEELGARYNGLMTKVVSTKITWMIWENLLFSLVGYQWTFR
jgi:hypothetical protein